MGKYLKMADVFDLPILGSRAEFFPLCLNESSAMIAAHAINSHGELVAEVERLRGALQDAYLDGCHYGWGMSANGYNSEYGGPNDWRLNNSFIESCSPDKYIIE